MAAKAAAQAGRPTIQNRQARFEYHLEATFEAGIVLRGSEIKSIREGRVQLQDGFCVFQGVQLVLRNVDIQPYSHGGYANHDGKRDRVLLLTATELRRIRNALKVKGTTVVPTKLYFTDRNICKLQIALARGKQHHDKRNTIKERDIQRDRDRGE
jgi:SsrA-binding protein